MKASGLTSVAPRFFFVPLNWLGAQKLSPNFLERAL